MKAQAIVTSQGRIVSLDIAGETIPLLSIEKRSHYLKKFARLCYNRLYLKNFKEK
ncbi:Mobile element protein [Streptococcus mitis]|uniref:Mobile element protein n=1 Tax=Streptococcus mitis TaxID=28037 RepID=A0A139PN25_STRMT|nr:Mobile element protein [Streptococcus mitis]